jgi:hypothetical protein
MYKRSGDLNQREEKAEKGKEKKEGEKKDR